jgi:acetoin utilization protein AcuC
MTQTAFVYDPATLGYDLGQHHPFKSIRPQAVKHLLETYGLTLELHSSEPASLEAILSVHARGYVERVQRASHGEHVADAVHYGIGTSDTPIFPAMHDATAAVVGATLHAAKLVRSGTSPRALSLAGGLHHARRDAGSGFCVYNDLSVAIQALVESGWRVAYLDVDAHHGDGVQWLHYEDPRVLTISLHESGRYLFPGTGYTYELGRGAGLGTSLNVPLEPYTDDASYLDCLERVLEPALAWFKPDVLVLQGGADAHALDPLAELNLSVQGYADVYRLAVRAAQTHTGGRIVATGGGGYATLTAVPRVWAQLYAALEDITLPDAIPDAWLETWQPQADQALPSRMRDAVPTLARRAEITARNAHTTDKLLEMWREVTGQ